MKRLSCTIIDSIESPHDPAVQLALAKLDGVPSPVPRALFYRRTGSDELGPVMEVLAGDGEWLQCPSSHEVVSAATWLDADEINALFAAAAGREPRE